MSSAAWPRAKPTARSTRTPGRRSASPRRRRSRASWWRSICSPCTWGRRGALCRGPRRPHIDALAAPARCCMEQTLKLAPQVEEVAARFYTRSRLPVSRPRHQLPHRARRRPEAERDLVHPRRGLPGRRDEARPHRAHRRADAGRGDCAARRRVREDARQHSGGQGARGLGDRRHQRGRRRARRLLDPKQDAVVGCRRRRPADAGRR